MISGRLAIVLVLAALGAHAGSSVARSNSAERMRSRLHEGEVDHANALASMRSNMSLASALQILREQTSGKPELMTLVQEAFQNKVSAKRSLSQLRAGSAPKGYSGVDKAKNMLNEMIEEVQEKYDLELQKCCDYDEMQSYLMEEARQDISQFNAEAAEARMEVLEAQAHIQVCETKLPELNDALEVHNTQCEEEITSLRAQLKIVEEDLSVMKIILGMTDCDKSLFLLSCVDSCTGESLVSFGHDSLHNAASKLHSSAARQLLNAGLVEAYRSGNATGNETVVFTTTEEPKMTVMRSGPCKEPVAADKRTGKCSMNSNPNCAKMQEKFLYISAGIEDKRDELKDQLQKLETDCRLARENFEGQISDFESKLKDQQTALAAATKKQSNAEGQSRLKNKELFTLQTDYAKMTTTCHTNYATLEGEQCGLGKIRGELYKMQGQDNPAFFQDCVVSEWLPEECSASCAGGVMQLTRKITTHPVGGSKCPVLVAQKPCNMHKCPINCKLMDWQGWSSCTAKCGGGIMERARAITVAPMHGGAACGETSEAMSCNTQNCDQDCELSDWTAWGGCSKECNGGTSERVKTIVTPVVGDGTCADMGGKERLEYKPCNQFLCQRPKGFATLRCESKVDVILVIDGSGSLGSSGWAASVKAGAMLARGFGGSKKLVNLAVLLFSWKSQWVQHFNSDTEAAAKKIEGLKWPRSATFTANALNAAKSELSLGRADAQSVVIVITDGRPMSTRQTGIAAHNLRQDARLMWVPVTRWAPIAQMKMWASHPVEENFLSLSSFADLTNPDKLDLIISDVCPELSR